MNLMPTEYVVGFCFNPSLTEVLLIRKQRPEWQHDLLNGIGGKVKPFESILTALKREFQEETGINPEGWKEVGVMHFSGTHAKVHCYCVKADEYYNASTQTDEEIVRCKISNLHLSEEFLPLVYNVEWLIPMALWILKGHKFIGESFQMPEKLC